LFCCFSSSQRHIGIELRVQKQLPVVLAMFENN
jgi:hypothetical protein